MIEPRALYEIVDLLVGETIEQRFAAQDGAGFFVVFVHSNDHWKILGIDARDV